MISVPAVAAESDHDASHCFTSMQQLYLASMRDMMQGRNSEYRLEAPVDSMEGLWSPEEEQLLNRLLHYAVVGGKQSRIPSRSCWKTQADELMFLSETCYFADRLRSYRVLSELTADLS